MLFAQGCNSENKNKIENSPKQRQAYSAKAQHSLTKNADVEMKKTLDSFTSSLKNKDTAEFKRLIADSGLIIIRNFVSGGNGTRGKDVRKCYCRDAIPAGLSFVVYKELPIDLSALFQITLNSGVTKNSIRHISGISFNLTDNCREKEYSPDISDVLPFVDTILIKTKASSEKSTLVFLNSKEALLFEADYIAGFSTGSFALFEHTLDSYRLRAIMDFR